MVFRGLLQIDSLQGIVYGALSEDLSSCFGIWPYI